MKPVIRGGLPIEVIVNLSNGNFEVITSYPYFIREDGGLFDHPDDLFESNFLIKIDNYNNGLIYNHVEHDLFKFRKRKWYKLSDTIYLPVTSWIIAHMSFLFQVSETDEYN